jgi:hypothetical protein
LSLLSLLGLLSLLSLLNCGTGAISQRPVA